MASTTALSRKDKGVLQEFDNNVRDFMRQFNEQQQALEIRTQNKIFFVNDLQEFFKRRAEYDLDYSQKLDRLCERFVERSSKQRNFYGLGKKDGASYVNLWSKLIVDAKFKAKTAQTLSEIYSKNLVSRLTELADDIQRNSRIVKDTHNTLQQRITSEISKLQTDMKLYFSKHADCINCEGKFRVSETEKKKFEESPQKKTNEKRLKNLEKNMDKRRMRFIDSKLKSIQARNNYILNVQSTTSIVAKYFDHDLSEMILKYDHNFHNSFSSTLQAFIGAEIRMANAQMQSANSLAHTISIMDAKNDVKLFLEENHNIFFLPTKFGFVPHADDHVQNITADEKIENDLKEEQIKLCEKLASYQVELSDIVVSMEKRKRLLDTTYKTYDSEINGFYHIDMTPVTGTSAPPASSTATTPQQLKLEKEEGEQGLLTKFREHVMMESVQSGCQAKYDLLTKALGEIASDPQRNKVVLGRKRNVKLFGTSLKSQLDETGEEIPDIVVSCARYIAKYGLRHQGIFRVPGSAQEITEMKVVFEEGRDPLSGLNHWKDINVVAGVFRCYFREMAEPLFPFECNHDYLRAASITRVDDQITEAKVILNKIPAWNLHVIKYMLKFLNLISRYSEHNKMTTHNLAVVFGPSLFRVNNDENLLSNQGQINVFIDILINEFYQIFPGEPTEDGFEDKTDGEALLSDDNDDGERTEDELDSEDDDFVEAIALYNYTARTSKEVSFAKGDMVTIFSRTNSDWWDARVNGKFGFVPVQYIKIVERPSSTSDSIERKKALNSPDEKLKSLAEDLSEVRVDRVNSRSDSRSDSRSNSRSDLPSSTEEQTSNIFSTIDPTIRPGSISPSISQRKDSDGSSSGRSSNPPSRSSSDKKPSRPYHIKSPTAPICSSDSELKPQNGKAPVLPSSVGRQYHMSQQNLTERKDDLSSPAQSTFPRTTGGSVKEKSKMFPNPILERPASAYARHPPGYLQFEPVDRTDNIPSFKPPPPPPASTKPNPPTKPKPRRGNVKDELAATVCAAAAAKSKVLNDPDDAKENTHL